MAQQVNDEESTSKKAFWLRFQTFFQETLKDPKRIIPAALILLALGGYALFSVAGPNELRTTDDPSEADVVGGINLGGGAFVDPAAVEEELASKESGGSSKSNKSGKAGKKAGRIVSAPPSLPPITDTKMKVGIAYISDPGAANQAAGFAGIGQIDQRRGWEAMLEEINRSKPFGREAVPVWYEYSTNDVVSKGSEQLYQEMCSKWTQDNKVFVVYAGSGADTLSACLTKAKIAQLGGGAGFSYAKTWKDFPYLIEHNSSALDRMARDQINQLHKYGYFDTCGKDPSVAPCVDGAPRIGLIRYDQPSHKAAAATMKATLASYGLQLCKDCEFEISYSDDDIAAQLDDATEVNNAINNCRLPHSAPGAPNGPCTHMLFLGSIAGVRITLFYVQRAEDQGYRAKLGFNRMDAPAAVRDFFANADQDQYLNQFKNSVLVSYALSDFGHEPPAVKDCVKLFEDAGEDFSGSEGSNKRGQIPGYCDTAWYHLAAFKAAGRNLSINAWLKGVANTGLVKSAGTFVMKTNANRHDGAGAIRIGDWDKGGDCLCWKDVSGDIFV